MAGADTTGITLRAIFYYVLKKPEIHRKLRTALQEANLTFPVAYDDAKDIPYLNAIISEATRMHPGIGFPLERVVPEEGLRLPDGRFLPAGTLVGMNPWVLNSDQAVYGPDADQFIPERWLQQGEETVAEWKERKRTMREVVLTFGAGNRVCLGKNASLLEMYKLTATLFSLYEVSDGNFKACFS
jgi:cytochrome P450